MAADMSPDAIERRLCEASRLSDLRPPFRARVDMSEEAIERRLREAAALFALASRLGGLAVVQPLAHTAAGYGGDGLGHAQR